MRKQRFLLLSIVFLFAACQKNGAPADDSRSVTVVSLNRSCAADDVLKAQLDADPGLQLRMNQIEDFTKKVIARGELLRTTTTAMVVPVVVHVLYNKQVENISDAQIQSQIDVLNEDFNLNNKDAFRCACHFFVLEKQRGYSFSIGKNGTEIYGSDLLAG
jgi:ABC-type metal ion transport system substrate-binding protein